jgi:hypothetical protein
MVAITVLAVASGVSARTRRAPLALVLGALAGVWALISACFALALLLPPETGGGAESLWLGLPRRAAIVLFGVGIVPLFVLPFVYAATFDALTLPEEELARIRAAAKRTPKVDPREAAA